MNQEIDIRAQGIHVHAPVSSYSLVFKHLRGSIIDGSNGTPPTYLCGVREYSPEEVTLLLTESAQPLPPNMLKGHTFASAAYIFGSRDCTGPYKVGVSLRPSSKGKISNKSLRRLALTNAIATLPAVDRAYFHLTMGLMEGMDVLSIVKTALGKRPGTDRKVLVHHLYSLAGAALTELGVIDTHDHIE